MDIIKLSYIISTRNRLNFLKITLEKLINELQSDEEIVVVDGNSTDGAKEYLNQLFLKGKIHQFISEPDKNQANGWNKALLLAKGTIIKKIIDDDVFCFSAIRNCKDFMLNNPSVDVVISNDLSSSLQDYKTIIPNSRQAQFEKWKNKITPSFTFGDVHMLIRKSSLANIGLYNTSYIMMDWEYSLRISYLRAKIVYSTSFNALSVSHPKTVSFLKNEKLIIEQGKRGGIFYEYNGDRSEINFWSEIKIFLGSLIFKDIQPIELNNTNYKNMNEVYEFFYTYINKINSDHKITFYE